MVDTIHLNLHNLEKNYEVYNWIIREGNNGVVKFDIDTNGKKVYNDNKELIGGLLSRQVKVYPEADKSTEVLRIHTRYEPSSHYSIIVEVHPKRDLIKFSFSIPKYFYGHNIAQAVQNTNERDFRFIRGFTDTFDYQIEQSHSRISTYIKSFFHTEFVGIEIDWTDIELVRLDICYNQFFNSKQDALFYLDMQKKIPKKFARRDNQNVTCYRTSIFYHSRDYSVKIYHKGTEYEKNDSKEHDRANKKYHLRHGINLYNINYLQDTADRILRYEITFRKDYLNYIFNTKIFRKNSKRYNQFKSVYNALHSLNEMSKTEQKNRLLHNVSDKVKTKYQLMSWDTIEPIYNEFKSIKISDGDDTFNICDFIAVYYKKQPLEKITRHMIVSSLNKFYQDFGNLLSKGRKIMFKLNPREQQEYEKDNKTNENFLRTVDYIPFSKDLCIELGKTLKQFCKDFKVNERDNLGTLIQNIHRHNEEIDLINKNKKSMLPLFKQSKFKSKKKIDVNRMSFILIALESHPLHDLRDMLHLSDDAFYRLKKDLENIGIDKNSINNIVPIPTKLDFSDYYTESSLHTREFFINNASTRLFSPNDAKLLRLLEAA
jgi:hypothetical protein